MSKKPTDSPTKVIVEKVIKEGERRQPLTERREPGGIGDAKNSGPTISQTPQTAQGSGQAPARPVKKP